MNEKFILCDTEQISNEIDKAKSIILNRNINDIWSAMLFEIKNSNLTIKATDRNILFQSTIPIVSAENFKVLINASNFSDAVKALNLYDELKINFNEDESKLSIIGESENKNDILVNDHLSEPTFSNEEIESYNYEINGEIYKFTVELSQREFKKIISKVSFSASHDESKNIMNGIYFTKDKNSALILISTNGHRMSIYKTDLVFEEDIKFIVPVKMFNLLKQMMVGEGMIKIKVSDKKFYVEFNNYKIVCSLISGNYPDYESVIPKEQKNRALVEINVLKDRLSRVSSYTDKRSKKVILSFASAQLKLMAEDPITGRKGEFFVQTPNYSYDGDDEIIAINSAYFTEAMGVFDTSNLEIKFNGEGGILKLSEPENSDFVHLIMPMILN
ncbi:DNA polymerase III subunit beta [Borrelia miyamotoi]|uniref:Beta sliding clamp n=1 Tax=Borrelia miyamotoi TaxID=47466 RepID=A0AAX3JM97_9SPIR|nr:DNA polymerase III subunit beta [Borrelia miyamotoi]QFP41908.1 DNA polymerase III subunit beta [Borrelia miyamotoi]QFP48028.1 DNA polymerase III subunit beta [Borrelia miyamotoi]QGT55785.1 DNA polymerase III subunit beta [Borrelia miyamotoi]QGT56566.1 DNA polymerase III subunit beta [Borrelia miyamotoi]WAZ71814.1 DNA polymerase III subunit beta [Borrelia miyamotoi]